jgi:tetratricopeptide (TPR) repeat protein
MPSFLPNLSESLTAAVAAHRAGLWDEAERLYREILAAQPDHVDALHLLGLVDRQAGRLDGAIDRLQRAIALKPDFADALGNLATVLTEAGRPDEALAAREQALALRPDHLPWRLQFARSLDASGRREEALSHLRVAAERHPADAGAWRQLGLAQSRRDLWSDARLSFEKVATLDPEDAENWMNLGSALRQTGDGPASELAYRRSLALRPGHAPAWSALGALFRSQRRFTDADAAYTRALELAPGDAEAHYQRAMVRLQTGDFARGWPELDWRAQLDCGRFPDFGAPRWTGQPIEGRTILLHAEQGLGDSMQFVRYARQIHEAGGRVTVGCPRALVRLLQRCPFIEHVMDTADGSERFDFHAPMMSLPAIFGTLSDSVPADVPYLFADPEASANWRDELVSIDGTRKIGIVWQGNPKHPGDPLRSFSLTRYEAIARLPGVRLLSLQKNAGPNPLAEASGRFPVTDLGSRLGDFADTADLMPHLDLVIACDTAVAHLAGAMGAPVWVALPWLPDWRWMMDRADSPWYPSMRLFRQQNPGEWDPVFAEMAEALGQAPLP